MADENMTQEEFYELQKRILSEDLHKNPKLPISNFYSLNKNVNTVKTDVIGAINELLEAIAYQNRMLEALSVDKDMQNLLLHAITSINGEKPDEQGNLSISLTPHEYDDVYQTPYNRAQTLFKLTKHPINGKIHFYLNGTRYFEPDVKYSAKTNSVIWEGSEETEGIDLSDSTVVIEYFISEQESKEVVRPEQDTSAWRYNFTIKENTQAIQLSTILSADDLKTVTNDNISGERGMADGMHRKIAVYFTGTNEHPIENEHQYIELPWTLNEGIENKEVVKRGSELKFSPHIDAPYSGFFLDENEGDPWLRIGMFGMDANYMIVKSTKPEYNNYNEEDKGGEK